MSITFRLSDETAPEVEPAVITARQLAAFRSLLRAHTAHSEIPLIDPEANAPVYLAYGFEARVCPLPLAVVSKPFGFDAAAIAVLEEAQFRGKRVSIWKDRGAGNIKMGVSLTSDLGLELDLATENGILLLEALGLTPETAGAITAKDAADRLADPNVRARFAILGIAQYLPRLDRLLGIRTCEDTEMFVWA